VPLGYKRRRWRNRLIVLILLISAQRGWVINTTPQPHYCTGKSFYQFRKRLIDFRVVRYGGGKYRPQRGSNPEQHNP
jgi:hypothetical protein